MRVLGSEWSELRVRVVDLISTAVKYSSPLIAFHDRCECYHVMYHRSQGLQLHACCVLCI